MPSLRSFQGKNLQPAGNIERFTISSFEADDPLEFPGRRRLFEQHHLARSGKIPGGQAIKVNAAGSAGAGLIPAIPEDAVAAGRMFALDQGAHQAAADIINFQADSAARSFGHREADCRGRVERIGEIRRETERLRQA